jgi:hypothetical protein
MKIPKYCRECGKELRIGSVDSDQVNVFYPDGMGGCRAKLDTSFNAETGEVNTAETRTCPNWNEGWKNLLFGLSQHDKIVIYKDDIHYI